MAGSWSRVTARGNNVVSGNPPNMVALAATFTADDSDASIPTLDLTAYPIAFVTDVGLKFDGTTPPDTCTVAVQDLDGLVVHPNDIITFTQSSRYVINDRPSCAGGVTVAITGNTVNSAEATLILYCVINQR